MRLSSPAASTGSALRWPCWQPPAIALAASWRPAHAAAEEMVIRTMGPVSYVCGGVAEDERQALAAKEKDFNIGILFTQAPTVNSCPTSTSSWCETNRKSPPSAPPARAV